MPYPFCEAPIAEMDHIILPRRWSSVGERFGTVFDVTRPKKIGTGATKVTKQYWKLSPRLVTGTQTSLGQ